MLGTSPIHVIDPDPSRRVQIFHEIMERGVHAEIYDGVVEFEANPPYMGAILAADCGKGEIHAIQQTFRVSGTVLPVIMYGEDPEVEQIVDAMLRGAIDYLHWPFGQDKLSLVLGKISSHSQKYFKWGRRRTQAKAALDLLTEREKEVLLHLTEGMSNKDVARKLNISPRTVEIHRANLMRKLNARSAADLVRIGLYADLDDHL